MEDTPSTAVVVERDGSFFVYQPDLGLVASDGTVEGAYRRFLEARQNLLQEANRGRLVLRHAGSETRPARLRRREAPATIQSTGVGYRSVGAELGMFVAKIFIFVIVVGAIGGVVGAGLDIKPLGIADIADKAADIARDVSSLSPEKKEQLRRSVGIISRELSPVGEAWRAPPP